MDRERNLPRAVGEIARAPLPGLEPQAVQELVVGRQVQLGNLSDI